MKTSNLSRQVSSNENPGLWVSKVRNYLFLITGFLILTIVLSIPSLAQGTKPDWMEDQPPTDRITRLQTNKLSTVTDFPRRSTGSLKEALSAQQLACFDMCCWKPFSISSVAAAQAINPNLVWLRIYCPQEWQGFTELPDKSGSGFPFNTSGPATANNQIFAGHFAYKPYTTLTAAIGTGSSITISVADASNIANGQYCVIRPADSWANAEHVKVSKSGSTITINTRGFRSTAKEWPAGSIIAQHQIGNGTTADNFCYNLSTRCPLDSNGKRACEAFAEWLALNYDKDPSGNPATAVCDGIQYDSDFDNFTRGGSVASRNADLDNDGVSDWGFSPDGTNFWGEGLELFYQNVRKGLDDRGKTNAIILGGVAESWGVLPNNGTQLEGGWDGVFAVGGKAPTKYTRINFFVSAMKAQTGHGVIGPRVTDSQSKCASALYNDNDETRNAPVRFSYCMTMMFDGAWFSSMNGYGDAFHYFDEDAVYTQGEDYGKSVLITNTADIRANSKWLGKALGQYQRIYDPALFTIEKNLMPNGNFESETIGWAGTLMATAERVTDKHYEGSGSLMITPTIPNPLSRTSDAKVKGPAVNLVSGKEYTLCFAIYSESPVRDIGVQLGSLNQSLFLTPGWNKHVLSWKEDTGGSIQPIFSVGAELTKIWLDQVYVFEGSADVFRRDFENGIILANATPVAKTINLNGPFHRIDGNLDRAVNSGEKNITQITVPANDGVFLVRPAVTSAGRNQVIDHRITLYPNPFTEKFTIAVPEGIRHIEIFKPGGNLVLKQMVEGRRTVEIDEMADRPSGLYFVRLSGNIESQFIKMVKL